MEIEKERGERRKVRRRTKQTGAIAGPSTAAVPATVDIEMGDASAVATATDPAASVGGEDKSNQTAVVEAEEDEFTIRKREAAEIDQLISPDIKSDVGASATGLYELVGESTSGSTVAKLFV